MDLFGLFPFLFKQVLRELLAELDAPLVEAVDVPDHALSEYLVLIQRDQAAEVARVEPLEAQRARSDSVSLTRSSAKTPRTSTK